MWTCGCAQDFCHNTSKVGDFSLQLAHYRWWLPLALKHGKKHYAALFIRAIEEFEMASASMKKLMELGNLAATQSGALEPLDLVGEHIVCEGSNVPTGGGRLTAAQKKAWGLTAEIRRVVKESFLVLKNGMKKDGSARERQNAEGVGVALRPTINRILAGIVIPSQLFSQLGRRGTGSPVLPLSSRQNRQMGKLLADRARFVTADQPWPHLLQFTEFAEVPPTAGEHIPRDDEESGTTMEVDTQQPPSDPKAPDDDAADSLPLASADGALSKCVLELLLHEKPTYANWLPRSLNDVYLFTAEMSLSEVKASGQVKRLNEFLKAELKYRNEQISLGRMPSIAGRLPVTVVSKQTSRLILTRNGNELTKSIAEHNQLLRQDRQKLIDGLPADAARANDQRDHRAREAQPKTAPTVPKQMWLPPKGALLVSIGGVLLPPRCDGGHSDSGPVSLRELVVYLKTSGKLSEADAASACNHLIGKEILLGWYVEHEPGFDPTADMQQRLREGQRRKAAYLEKQKNMAEATNRPGSMEDAMLRGVVGSGGDYASAELAGLSQVLTGSGRSRQVASSRRPDAAKTYLVLKDSKELVLRHCEKRRVNPKTAANTRARNSADKVRFARSFV